MLVSKLAYHTEILATGSVTTHIEVSRLTGLRWSSVLDITGAADGAGGGRGLGRASLGRR